MKKFLHSWVINTLAVLLAVYLVRGIDYKGPIDLIVASLLLGILNAVVRPVLLLLSLPVLLVTLGLFTLVINAGLLYLVSNLLSPNFHVANFRAAFWGAVVIWLVSVVLNVLTGNSRARIRVERHKRPPDHGPKGGSGPVIDI